jgi:Na+/proline symporter
MHVTELWITVALFARVAGMGFVAANWRRPPHLHSLDEWSLAGRKFGGWLGWFMLGGDLYTAYTFVAVPALLYGTGALGFFAIPYTAIEYPLVFLLMIRLWSVCRTHGYVTPADYVRGRFGSPTLALAVALTGVLTTRSRDVVKRSVAWLPLYSVVLALIALLGLVAYTRWMHRAGLIAGWLAGMVTSVWMLYVTANPAAGQAHWGGSAFAPSHLGLDTKVALYTGFVGVLVNLAVVAVATLAARALRIRDGADATAPDDYFTDEEDVTGAEAPPEVALA